MDDLILEFLAETNESLEELDLDLVNLEQNPNDKDLLSKIFRLMHTIKGTCGFLGLPRLEKVAHHAENVLGRFRDGELEVTAEYVTLIFESIDTIKHIVGELEATGAEPDGDDTLLIEKLDAAFEGKGLSEAGSSDSGDKAGEDASETKSDEAAGDDGAEAGIDTTPPPTPGGVLTQEEMDALEQAFNDAPGPEGEGDSGAAEAPGEPEEAMEPSAEETAAPEPAAAASPPPQPAPAAEAKEPPKTVQSLRVNVDVLENLMTMVSELVLTRNQLLQILRTQSESEFNVPLQRLNHVVSDLQDGVMKTRMQPIGNAWAKLPRIVRDISIELGKKVELDMRGQDTELDRQVLDLIKDPLTHMVRNSADHGIEKPEERVAAGKPEGGKIILNAYHEGGHIIIDITDDGKGIPVDKIKAKAIEKGLVSAEDAEEMGPNQIYQFIFSPGFSTAEKVTSVSGRGVGMDVVRTNIEKIGGSIELKSVEGKGSTFLIKIPLTLAIVSSLIVEASGEKFAIPQIAVRELVMASNEGDNRIEMIKGTPVFRLRDSLLPLVSLSKTLRLVDKDLGAARPRPSIDDIPEAKVLHQNVAKLNGSAPPSAANDIEASVGEDVLPDSEGLEDGHKKEAQSETYALSKPSKSGVSQNQYIVVTQVGAYEFGIIVDRVYDTEEIVVKPVPTILSDIELFSGNTILGDGTVIMILDPNGIAKASGDISSEAKEDAAQTSSAAFSSSEEKTSLLLFRAGDSAPKAVPLSLVARLENIDFSNVEYSSGKAMVQYRKQLMPLLPLNSAVGVPEDGEKPVLVFSNHDNSMGLIVDEIVDIIEEHIDVQLEGAKEGLIGSAIINGRATDVVDVAHYLYQINENWFKNHDDTPFGENGEGSHAERGKLKLLLVDDSPFFRNMLSPVLSVAGYDVTAVESPFIALDMCEQGDRKFDIIISDIEMPEMNGFEFAEKVKHESNWKDTPIVALTSHATPEDINRGKTVGFNDYVAKFDRDTLLNALTKTLTETQQRKAS